MGIIGWVLLGLLAGAIAKAQPGADVEELVELADIERARDQAAEQRSGDPDQRRDDDPPGSSPGTIIAIAGSLLLLLIYRAFTGRRRTTRPRRS